MDSPEVGRTVRVDATGNDMRRFGTVVGMAGHEITVKLFGATARPRSKPTGSSRRESPRRPSTRSRPHDPATVPTGHTGGALS
jgi:hypothetical protein